MFTLRNKSDGRVKYLNKVMNISLWSSEQISYPYLFRNRFIYSTILYDFIEANYWSKYTTKSYISDNKRIFSIIFNRAVAFILCILHGPKYFMIDDLNYKYYYLQGI
jgi:hypothetical protein